MKVVKKILSGAAIISGMATGMAQQTLTVHVLGMLPKGMLEVSLYNSATGFPVKAKPAAAKKIKVNGNSATVQFTNLAKGDYAIALYQDENSNGKCDTNFIGFPTEGFGFSNNVRPKLAPPSFQESKVHLEQNKTITISLIR